MINLTKARLAQLINIKPRLINIEHIKGDYLKLTFEDNIVLLIPASGKALVNFGNIDPVG